MDFAKVVRADYLEDFVRRHRDYDLPQLRDGLEYVAKCGIVQIRIEGMRRTHVIVLAQEAMQHWFGRYGRHRCPEPDEEPAPLPRLCDLEGQMLNGELPRLVQGSYATTLSDELLKELKGK